MIAAPNPVRTDPTRLAGPRRAFAADLRRRFLRLQRRIESALDAPHAIAFNWPNLPADQQVATFERWLDRELNLHFGGDWWLPYLADAYERSAARAFDRERRAGMNPPGHAAQREEFLRHLLASKPASPVANALTANARDAAGRFLSERAKLLAARLERELKGCTTLAAQNLARELIKGIEAGHKPRTIAIAMRKVTDIAFKRALVVARTELTRAAADGSLDAMGELGIDTVGVEAEWQTAGNPCPRCSEMEGQTFSIEEARGLIPLHPNCACAWAAVEVKKPLVPVAPKSTEVETATRAEVDAAIEAGATEVYRGIASAKSARSMRQGKHYVGGGDYGSGAYFATDRYTAELYSGGVRGGVIRAAVKPGAKLVHVDELYKQLDAAIDAGKVSATIDLGEFARKQGYDGISVPSYGYVNIVNPDALLVESTPPRRPRR